MKHCTDELLEKYLDRRCGLIRSARVSAHLRKCIECNSKLEVFREDRKLIAEIREAVSNQPEVEKMEAEFKGLGRLRELFGDEGGGSKTATGR